MSTFEELLNELFADYVKPHSILARIFVLKFIEKGCISKANYKLAFDSIRSQLISLEASGDIFEVIGNQGLSIALDDEILEPNYRNGVFNENLDLSVEDAKVDQELLLKVIDKTAKKLNERMVDNLESEWRKVFNQELGRIKKDRMKFAERVYELWGDALDQLDLLIDLCCHLGSVFNNTYRKFAVLHRDHKFEALTRVHARSCQVSSEIHTLLCSGFADGANARWRTLHELTVISTFLAKNDDETSQRFLLHSQIEEYKLMETYQESARRLGWSPIPQQNLDEAKAISDQLKMQFSTKFKDDYGWATNVIQKSGRIEFVDIEKFADRENFKSPFKISHKQVHATAYGTLFPLSASPTVDQLVAGGSIFGLGEPGRQMAQAICMITANLLLSRTQMEHNVSLQALIPIRDDIWTAFNDVETKIEGLVLSSSETDDSHMIPNIPTIKIKRRKAKHVP